MDYDITNWLKNELNLAHSSESDLSDIIYHPRHGALMRRFVNFLAKSTLCKDKYPDVFAEEEKSFAESEYEMRCQERDRLKVKLDSYIRESIVLERKVSGLEQRHKSLKRNKRKQSETVRNMELMAKRSRGNLDQVAVRMDKAGEEYLGRDYLAEMYNQSARLAGGDSSGGESSSENDVMKATFITNQQLSLLDESLANCKEKIELEHDAISELIGKIKLENLKIAGGGEICLKKRRPAGELAQQTNQAEELPASDFCDEPELRQLEETRQQLKREVEKVAKSLSELNEQYKMQKLIVSRPFQKVVDEYYSPTLSSMTIAKRIKSLSSADGAAAAARRNTPTITLGSSEM